MARPPCLASVSRASSADFSRRAVSTPWATAGETPVACSRAALALQARLRSPKARMRLHSVADPSPGTELSATHAARSSGVRPVGAGNRSAAKRDSRLAMVKLSVGGVVGEGRGPYVGWGWGWGGCEDLVRAGCQGWLGCASAIGCRWVPAADAGMAEGDGSVTSAGAGQARQERGQKRPARNRPVRRRRRGRPKVGQGLGPYVGWGGGGWKDLVRVGCQGWLGCASAIGCRWVPAADAGMAEGGGSVRRRVRPAG